MLRNSVEQGNQIVARELLNGTPPPAAQLQQWLQDARARTLALTEDVDGERLLGPLLPIVNPPLWELAHVAWFQEYWCLRLRADGTRAASLTPFADWLYNSALIPHDARWLAPLLPRAAVQDYLRRVLDAVLERLEKENSNEQLAYFAQLAVFHEDMHGEAFFYTRQTHGYARPALGTAPVAAEQSEPATLAREVEIPGGCFMLGAGKGSGFVFDNEKWSHEVELQPYAIDATAVTNGQFLDFVRDGGYQRAELWSEAGNTWRKSVQALAPLYWRERDGQWLQREFDAWVPLRTQAPIIFLNWYEAQAYCAWAKRRLPSEAEWEFAASMSRDGSGKRRFPWGEQPPTPAHANLDGITTHCAPVQAYAAGASGFGCRQMLGNVWEWTADSFNPYPGFEIDPYQEYSEPWFGDHKVLRGGCFATRSRLIRNTWRNFYTPDRRDVFAGFRTCRL